MAAPAVSPLRTYGVCSSCVRRAIWRPTPRDVHGAVAAAHRKLLSNSISAARAPKSSLRLSQTFIRDYFSANTSIERGWVNSGLLAAVRTAAEPSYGSADHPLQTAGSVHRTEGQRVYFGSSHAPAAAETAPVAQSVESTPPAAEPAEKIPLAAEEDELPHRRRKRRREKESGSDASEEQLPLDASSRLTTAASALPKAASFRRQFATFLSLTKPRLSFLILLTTTSAYSLYPIPEILSSTVSSVETSLSTSTLTLLFLTTGTFLSCACANTLNMLFEPKYDALMTRTRNRPLVRKLISPRAAALFAFACGASGLLILGLGTNPTVAGLSALNIFLYAGVYTPMKRLSAANTWVGAIVGGIPPLMGWCAAAGQAATSEHHSWTDMLFSEDSLGGWALAALLFAWQFPHFMSLSHIIRDDYKNAGHQMLAWTNPARNARVALRYSIAMFPICGFLYWGGYVNSGFLAISTVCNIWMTREAVRFWKKQGAGGSARGLFWASVWQLPLVLVGALACKTGIWDGLFRSDEATSIYDDDLVEVEGDSLGMHEPIKKRPSPPGDINLAMMGFKRPT